MDSFTNNEIGVLRDSLTNAWDSVVGFLPQLVGAIIVFIIGWLVAVIVAKLAWHLIKIIQLDRLLESIGFKKVWEKSGYKLNSSMFFYELVKWFFIIVALMASTNILGLEQITDLLGQVVLYLPNVFVAAVVLIIGVMIARFLEGLIRGSVKAAELGSPAMLARIAKWAVLIFSFLIALSQLKVATSIVDRAVEGAVIAVALAVGLSFGLGGKDFAKSILDKVQKDIEE